MPFRMAVLKKYANEMRKPKGHEFAIVVRAADQQES